MDGGGVDQRPADGAVRRFDLAMQRAVGAGLAVAVAQCVATAALGRPLYPGWWWSTVGPVAFVVAGVAVAQCATGRFGGRARTACAAGVAASAAATAVATGNSVRDVGTAVLPIVLMTIVGIGFLAPPVPAAGLGGLVIAADTLVPALLQPSAAPLFLTQAAIQSLILVATALGGRAARRFTAAEEHALGQLAEVLVADRAASAARAERRELEREMHDTVLNTLSAIGRSGLPDSEAVRRRCSADARFLRTLREEGDTATGLLGRLRSMIDPMVEDGFPVTLHRVRADGGDDLPREVVTALVRATREALNNAREHSGADAAHVDVDMAGQAVTVRVTDRGIGIGRSRNPRRLGVRRSLTERLADAGGRADVRHVAGEGTTVTLRWPR